MIYSISTQDSYTTIMNVCISLCSFTSLTCNKGCFKLLAYIVIADFLAWLTVLIITDFVIAEASKQIILLTHSCIHLKIFIFIHLFICLVFFSAIPQCKLIVTVRIFCFFNALQCLTVKRALDHVTGRKFIPVGLFILHKHFKAHPFRQHRDGHSAGLPT